MKLTFSTLGCPGYTLGQILELAKHFGFDTIELRGIGDKLSVDSIPELFLENRGKLVEELDSAGVGICMLDCSASLAVEKNIESSLSEAEYAVKTAASLGIPFIRVFGGENDDPVRAVKLLSRNMKRLCDLEPDVTILLETHDSFSNFETIEAAADSIGCDNFGILWDAEHTLRAGVDTDEFLRRFGKLIKHVHLKDYDENRLCLPGDGIVDLRAIRGSLEEIGYNGLLSLEWEKRWVRSLPDIEPALERFTDILR